MKTPKAINSPTRPELPKVRILIAVVTRRGGTGYFWNLRQNHLALGQDAVAYGCGVDHAVVDGDFIHEQRNQCCKFAIEGNFTHIFFIDDDTAGTAGTLPKLLQLMQSRQCDITCGVTPIFRDGRLFANCVPAKLAESVGSIFLPLWPEGTFEVSRTGMACTLITVDLLKRMPAGGWFRRTLDMDPAQKCPIGEDVDFCIRARQEFGAHIWVDCSIQCSHYKWTDFKWIAPPNPEGPTYLFDEFTIRPGHLFAAFPFGPPDESNRIVIPAGVVATEPTPPAGTPVEDAK